MRRRTFRLISAMMASLSLLGFCVSAMACTGFYVGKDASANGAVMLARTVDLHPLAAMFRVLVVDRVEDQPGQHHTGTQGFSWPLPDTTFKYTSTPMATGMGFGRYGSACMNEMGLAITGTVTAYARKEIRQMDPAVEGGLCEEVIPELIAASCASAREGVALIGKIMAELGSSEQNIIMLADANEAWYVETYTGHQWAALRMPEDKVAVFGNQFMIRYLDQDSEGALYSPGLFKEPEKAGLAVYGEDGRMDISRTYAGSLSDYGNRRTWIGHKTLAPSTAGDYDINTQYDLFYTPDDKVSVKDLMALTRNRFEGTPFSPEETGRGDLRVIGTESQGTAHILQVFDGLPAALSCVGWQCLANAEHSVYLPISNVVTDTAESYKRDSLERGYQPEMASIAYKRLCALAEQDRMNYGAGVRGYWDGMEEKLLAEYPEVLAKAADLYDNSPKDAAAHLTEYTVRTQEKAYEDANTLFEELLWYVMDHTDTLKYSFSYDTLTMGEIPTQKPFVPILALE
ncbi:MAG: C69 family dipeptidase [Eubacteriales bacterium]|nr:C69 family dipeptidase [Eubacteriales bacterium]